MLVVVDYYCNVICDGMKEMTVKHTVVICCPLAVCVCVRTKHHGTCCVPLPNSVSNFFVFFLIAEVKKVLSWMEMTF